MKEVLLIVDMLNDFVREEAALEVPKARAILPALGERLRRAREAGMPVVFLCDRHAPDDREFERWPVHAVSGSDGAEVVAELAPRPGEMVVAKTSYSGFYGTELEALLRQLGTEEVVLTGCVTNICILYTAVDAVMRGLRVRVPVDCVADLDAAAGAFALSQMERVLGAVLER